RRHRPPARRRSPLRRAARAAAPAARAPPPLPPSVDRRVHRARGAFARRARSLPVSILVSRPRNSLAFGRAGGQPAALLVGHVPTGMVPPRALHAGLLHGLGAQGISRTGTSFGTSLGRLPLRTTGPGRWR